MSLVFGLTGGQSAGIRQVAKAYKDAGVPCIHADMVFQEILKETAQAILLPNVDPSEEEVTAILWRQVLQVPETFEELQKRTYLRIAERLRHRVAEGAPLICLYAPSLIESGFHVRFRPLVVVVTPYEQQVRDEMARTGLNEAQAKKRLAWETPQSQKVLLADYLLDNKGTEDELLKEALWVLTQIRKKQVSGLKAKGLDSCPRPFSVSVPIPVVVVLAGPTTLVGLSAGVLRRRHEDLLRRRGRAVSAATDDDLRRSILRTGSGCGCLRSRGAVRLLRFASLPTGLASGWSGKALLRKEALLPSRVDEIDLAVPTGDRHVLEKITHVGALGSSGF